MSIIKGIARALGISDPTTSPQHQPGKPALTPEQIQERVDYLRSPQYAAVRRETCARMGIRVENEQPRNDPGEHDWLKSGQGR